MFGYYYQASDQACTKLDLLKTKTVFKSPKYGYYQVRYFALSKGVDDLCENINSIFVLLSVYVMYVQRVSAHHCADFRGIPNEFWHHKRHSE